MGAERQLTADYEPKSAARLRNAVLALADRQHGVVALWQLLARGMAERTVGTWVSSGRLQRIHQGVFVVGHRALRREGHYLAAVLACGPGAVLSHRSAAALLDLRSSATTRIDVTVPGRVGRSRAGIRVHSGDRLVDDEVTSLSGIPCTAAARTILDLAAVLNRRGLEQLVERAERIEIFDLFQVSRLVVRHRGRRGVARLRAVLSEWDEDVMRCRSESEILFLKEIVACGIDRPIVNGQIGLRAMSPEVDFHWPQHRFIVEIDSVAFHDNPLARKRDAERDAALAEAGWEVLRLRWTDVTEEALRSVQAVRRRLATPTEAPSGS